MNESEKKIEELEAKIDELVSKEREKYVSLSFRTLAEKINERTFKKSIKYQTWNQQRINKRLPKLIQKKRDKIKKLQTKFLESKKVEEEQGEHEEEQELI